MKELIRFIINYWLYDWKYINCFFTYESAKKLNEILLKNNIWITMMWMWYYNGSTFLDHWESVSVSDEYNSVNVYSDVIEFLEDCKDNDQIHFEFYFKDKRINDTIKLIFIK